MAISGSNVGENKISYLKSPNNLTIIESGKKCLVLIIGSFSELSINETYLFVEVIYSNKTLSRFSRNK